MKRLFDILGTLFLLSVLWAPLVCLCLLQLTLMGKPIFFRQERAGLKGQPLSILKFRTMLNGGGSDADRLTPWGKLLRSTSLDELPELWNVLRGEMSLVGPRPLPIHYLERYTPRQNQRHNIRPGITGWAQVNGRDELSIPDKVALDVEYLNCQSLWFDIKILWKTFLKVLKRDGVSQ